MVQVLLKSFIPLENKLADVMGVCNKTVPVSSWEVTKLRPSLVKEGRNFLSSQELICICLLCVLPVGDSKTKNKNKKCLVYDLLRMQPRDELV